MGDESFFNKLHSPYVTMGTNGTTLFISIVLLIVNLYMTCCSRSARKLKTLLTSRTEAKEGEEGNLEPLWPRTNQPPPPPQAPTIIQIPSSPPAYQPPIQNHQLQVTLSQEQIAEMMGINRRGGPQNRRAIEFLDGE